MSLLAFRPGMPGFPTHLGTLRSGPLAPVSVVVLDSGVDATHPWLRGRVDLACTVREIDGSLAACPADARANNDEFGHGTAVASIIAGIAPNARVVDVRVLSSGSTGTGAALVKGLDHAVKLGVPLVNMSLAASERFATPLRELVTRAYRQSQILVASKRNMPLLDNGYPAEFSDTVSVDSVPTAQLLSVLYRAGEPIEFAAQGEEVRVAAPGGGYSVRTGTSLATPVVTGVIALLLGANPDLRPFEIKTILKMYSEQAR